MTVTNSTRYNTNTLRKIFEACLREVRKDWALDWHKLKPLQVKIVYGRRKHFVGGRGRVNRGWMKIHIPSDWKPIPDYKPMSGYANDDLTQAIAATFIHELGHNLGIHGHLPAVPGGWRGYTIEHNYQDFIYANISADKFVLEPAQPQKATSDIREQRYLKSVANLQKALTRFKRAQTLLKKWTKKVKYYETALPQLANRPKK